MNREMDRNEMLRAARKLAADTVASLGSDGDAQDAFLKAADEQGAFQQLGASNLLDVWRDATGIAHK